MTGTLAREARDAPHGVRVSRGHPLPLGATAVSGGVNFAVYCVGASELALVLMDPRDGAVLAELPFPEEYRSGEVYAMTVLGLRPETADYGYRTHREGPVLLDPVATAVAGGERWGERPAYRSRIMIDDFDWEDDGPPGHASRDLAIYELHVRGFTRSPSSGVAAPGTFAGLREKIPYLRWLGINCVELMPVFEFDETDNIHADPRTGEPLRNFWGYNPVAFFAPKAAYASRPEQAGRELKELVKDLHSAGIEVILDVVFNHSGEGDHRGPLISQRGLAEGTYYLLTPEGWHRNLTATGNTINCNHPVVREWILHCVRHWAVEYHVDGFRFDMAAILGRGTDGEVLDSAPLLEALAADPVLADRRLIAEPWDATGLDQSGRFAAYGNWAEWNGHFRDAVRRFLIGEPGVAPELAARLTGSSDLFDDRSPTASVNFVTCHDGLTLADWAAYGERHNEANGEDGADGIVHNHSANHGVEGPTDDPEILELRGRQVRNALVLTLLSHGVPMLLAGDEFGRTQRGNNNAYAHDDELSWVDWQLLEQNAGLAGFLRDLIAFRKAHLAVRPGGEIAWHGVRPGEPDWSTGSTLLAVTLRHGAEAVYLAANAAASPIRLLLPEGRWRPYLDTATPHGPRLGLPCGDAVVLSPRSVILLTEGHEESP